MSKVSEVRLPVSGPVASEALNLHIWLRDASERDGDPPPLLDERSEPDRDSSIAAVQLLEGYEYGYEFADAGAAGVVSVDTPEVFSPDLKTNGRRGRLRPGLYTGTIRTAVSVEGHTIGDCCFEVRSRKIDYLRHYRWMLGDIASVAAETIMQRFAPSEQSFSVDDTGDSRTLYQRFAFLKSLLSSDSFRASLQRVVSDPHTTWCDEAEFRPIGRGLRSSSRVARELSRAGLRRESPAHLVESIPTMPEVVCVMRTEATRDNPPNRFVKYALSRWRAVVQAILDSFRGSVPTAPIVRGCQEAEQLVGELDAALDSQVFREVGRLDQFPANNQVLLKREGYRDVYRAYVEFELAAKLAWNGGEDVYGAGQRDVATLYEYWVFIQLCRIVAKLCKPDFDVAQLLEVRDDELNLSLRRGARCVVSGTAVRGDRRLQLELWFNRTFGTRDSQPASWSRAMRPDCSIHIIPERRDPLSTVRESSDDVWLHFDAKYRVDDLRSVFGRRPTNEDEERKDAEDDEELERAGRTKRADLLKMHAYRDAIRRSAGAYVLYPGTEEERLPEYQEILPGLGAFALSPSESGPDSARGRDQLVQFIEDVMDHMGMYGTQHERARFWIREAYEIGDKDKLKVPSDAGAIPYSPLLEKPPADTRVVLGYLRSSECDACRDRGLFYYHALDERGTPEDFDPAELRGDVLVPYTGSRTERRWLGWYGQVSSCELVDRGSLERELGQGVLVSKASYYYVVHLRLETVRDLDHLPAVPPPVVGPPRVVSWTDLFVSPKS